MKLFSASSEAAPDAKAVRRARLDAARRAGWQELDAAALVPRGPSRLGLFVHAESDAVYSVYRGATFETGSANLLADKQTNLAFYLDEDGSPVVLERQRETWSELYGRQARREARR